MLFLVFLKHFYWLRIKYIHSMKIDEQKQLIINYSTPPTEENCAKVECNKILSRLIGKLTICIGENKDADQLRGYHEADQRLCFRYWDSTIPLLLQSEISSF